MSSSAAENSNGNGRSENSPLLASTQSPRDDDEDAMITAVMQDEVPTGNASMWQTMVNMAKACMGQGCLVLPFAAKQGGLGLHTFGLMAIALWNIYTVRRLCQCLDYLPIPASSSSSAAHQQPRTQSSLSCQIYQNPPPPGTAMFGQVVWYAVGPKGLVTLDLLMLSFLMGILITYINAMRSFLWDTPLSTQSPVMDALLLVAIMGPLSSVPHMGYLSKASALGLLVLAATFVVLGIYGILLQKETLLVGEGDEQSAPISISWTPHEGLWGTSQWFGSVVFGFGVSPLTYNFRSSMADPSQMVPATGYALTGVALTYMFVGIFFCQLFPHLQGDLLQALPTSPTILLWPSMIRLAMVVVGLTTVPILVVPCGELVEGKVLPLLSSSRNNIDNDNNNPQPQTSRHRRILFRVSICLLAVGVSLYVPGFVDVLSFVGCCCVACLGFCIPPLLHAMLGYQARRQRPIHVGSMVLDCLMLVWGVFATVVSTTYTFRQISTVTAVVGGK